MGVRDAGRSPWREGARVPWLAAALAIAPIVAICVLLPPFYAMNPDDQVQALFASGRFLNADAGLMMPYTLAPVSVPLGLLYRVAPAVPWYPFLLLAGTAVSFAIAFDHLWRGRMHDGLCAVMTVLLLGLEVVTLGYFTYTIVAFLVISAGFMLLLRRCAFARAGRPHASDLAACLLIVAGYALRPESGMAAVAVFSPFALWVLVRNRHAGAILRGVAALACIGLAVAAGQAAYRATPGWETYPDYLDAGRSVLDYPELSVEEVRSVAPELSANDVEVMYDWDFIDEEVFGTELFERVGEASTRFYPQNLVDSLGAKTTYLLIAFALFAGLIAWLVGRDMGRRDVLVLAMGVAFMLLVSYGLLVLRARPRLHVVIPLLAVALFALTTCGFAPKAESRGSHAAAPRHAGAISGRLAVAAPIATALVTAAACLGFFLMTVLPVRDQASAPTVAAAHAYVEDHPDQLIVCGHTQSLLYAGFDAMAFEGWEFPGNVLPIGGWESHTAPWYEFLGRNGLSPRDALMELGRRDDMVAILQPRAMGLMEAYLTEHLGRPVACEVVEDLGPGVVDPSAHLLVCRFS